MTKAKKLVEGAIQGQIDLPQAVRAAATVLAREVVAEGEAQEWCGEAVTWLPDEGLLPQCMPLFPEDAVRALGFEHDPRKNARVWGTYGVGSHEDGEGIVFVLVLENQGLKFKQGRQMHITAPGQWYLFNDRRPHEVKEGKGSGAYIFFHVPLKQINIMR